MSLTLDSNSARQADNRSSTISEAGKYVGTITRAEKLLSEKGTQGVGFSFKADDGATANYLDVYTVNNQGESLPGANVVNAILACTKTRQADEGKISCEKWDKQAKQSYKADVDGYPALMGKRIGFLFQKEIQTNNQTHADVERVIIYGVFDPETELTASEILDKKTQPEKLPKMVQALMARPVNDRRTNKTSSHKPATSNSSGGSSFDDFEDDIPF